MTGTCPCCRSSPARREPLSIWWPAAAATSRDNPTRSRRDQLFKRRVFGACSNDSIFQCLRKCSQVTLGRFLVATASAIAASAPCGSPRVVAEDRADCRNFPARHRPGALPPRRCARRSPATSDLAGHEPSSSCHRYPAAGRRNLSVGGSIAVWRASRARTDQKSISLVFGHLQGFPTRKDGLI